MNRCCLFRKRVSHNPISQVSSFQYYLPVFPVFPVIPVETGIQILDRKHRFPRIQLGNPALYGSRGDGANAHARACRPQKANKERCQTHRRIGLLYRKGSYREQAFREIQGLIQARVGDYLVKRAYELSYLYLDFSLT